MIVKFVEIDEVFLVNLGFKFECTVLKMEEIVENGLIGDVVQIIRDRDLTFQDQESLEYFLIEEISIDEILELKKTKQKLSFLITMLVKFFTIIVIGRKF